MAKPVPSRRVTDLAIIAPVLAFILMIPPVIGLFATDGSVFGAPTLLIYLLVIWLGMIVGAAVLARKLAPAEGNEDV
jgi:membrane protein required for beta-lactamase induction